MKIKPTNDFILVNLKLKDVADNGMIIEDEVSGDGSIVPCVVIDPNIYHLTKNTIAYVPYYALQKIKDNIYVCSIKSVVAYELD